jgi:hypothetical protein
VRALTGRPFQSSERSISTNPRWPGVVGLYDFSAMFATSVCLADPAKGPDVVGPRRCPTWLSRLTKNLAPEESGAMSMAASMTRADVGQVHEVGNMEYKTPSFCQKRFF